MAVKKSTQLIAGTADNVIERENLTPGGNMAPVIKLGASDIQERCELAGGEKKQCVQDLTQLKKALQKICAEEDAPAQCGDFINGDEFILDDSKFATRALKESKIGDAGKARIAKIESVSKVCKEVITKVYGADKALRYSPAFDICVAESKRSSNVLECLGKLANRENITYKDTGFCYRLEETESTSPEEVCKKVITKLFGADEAVRYSPAFDKCISESRRSSNVLECLGKLVNQEKITVTSAVTCYNLQ